MYNHNKAQQSKNRVHISWDILYTCVNKLTIIDSDNGLSFHRRQAIILINAGIVWIGPLGTNCSEIVIRIDAFSFKKCIWKCRPEHGDHFVSASIFQDYQLLK